MMIVLILVLKDRGEWYNGDGLIGVIFLVNRGDSVHY